jgi:hypothetical protein
MNNESMKLALNRAGIQELLEQSGYDNANPEEKAAFISGIRHREAFLLAEQEQGEPVGFVVDRYNGANTPASPPTPVVAWLNDNPKIGQIFYTKPQQQRKPLTMFDTEKLAKQCGVEWTTRIDKLCKLAADHNIKE